MSTRDSGSKKLDELYAAGVKPRHFKRAAAAENPEPGQISGSEGVAAEVHVAFEEKVVCRLILKSASLSRALIFR
jgi:hypothetical protein